MRENKRPILALAFGGTLISFLIVGFSSMWLMHLAIPAAFVFAALMSATDPVSVLSIFKSVGAPKSFRSSLKEKACSMTGWRLCCSTFPLFT
ncbi:cation:proton antiporter [Bacillus stercoris]|nr:cation:proton antiporter [Bacillus stercoris]